MTRALWLLVALAACTGNDNSPPNEVFDMDVAWQVRCPDCTYPQHAINGTINVDHNPNKFEGGCTINHDNVFAYVGQTSDASLNLPGYDMVVTLGYDPSTGFDLSRLCHAQVVETDYRGWEATCSNAGDCHIEPTLADGALSFTLHCAGMTSYPFGGGEQATLDVGPLSGTEISASIGPCSL